VANHEPHAGPTTSDTGRHAPPRAANGGGKAADDGAGATRQAMDDGKDAAEQGGAIAQGAAKTGLDAASDVMERSTNEFKQTLDQLTQQGDGLARRSRQSLAAMADCGSIMMRGAHDISQAWIDLAQARVQRRVDSLGTLARCKTPTDFVKAQSGLLRDSFEQIADTNRRVAQLSVQVVQEAAEKMTASVKSVAA
jgi:hypothetical protein